VLPSKGRGPNTCQLCFWKKIKSERPGMGLSCRDAPLFGKLAAKALLKILLQHRAGGVTDGKVIFFGVATVFPKMGAFEPGRLAPRACPPNHGQPAPDPFTFSPSRWPRPTPLGPLPPGFSAPNRLPDRPPITLSFGCPPHDMTAARPAAPLEGELLVPPLVDHPCGRAAIFSLSLQSRDGWGRCRGPWNGHTALPPRRALH